MIVSDFKSEMNLTEIFQRKLSSSICNLSPLLIFNKVVIFPFLNITRRSLELDKYKSLNSEERILLWELLLYDKQLREPLELPPNMNPEVLNDKVVYGVSTIFYIGVHF